MKIKHENLTLILDLKDKKLSPVAEAMIQTFIKVSIINIILPNIMQLVNTYEKLEKLPKQNNNNNIIN